MQNIHDDDDDDNNNNDDDDDVNLISFFEDQFMVQPLSLNRVSKNIQFTMT